MIARWALGVACEVPYHRMRRRSRRMGRPAVDVVGDSLGASLGEADPWPDRLARRRAIVVRNHSIAGAGAAKALESESGPISGPGPLVLVD